MVELGKGMEIYWTGVTTGSIAKIYWNRQESDLIRATGTWMKPKGQVSKFTCTNTVTSSRTLVKSHKVFQKDSPKAVLEKSWSEKFHKKFTQKRLLWSPFFSYLTTCNFTEKKPHHSYFPMTFEKIFQNTVLCQNTGKATEGTEVFVRICFRKKLIWRISQNSSKINYDGVLF